MLFAKQSHQKSYRHIEKRYRRKVATHVVKRWYRSGSFLSHVKVLLAIDFHASAIAVLIAFYNTFEIL
jgi:hypothetical protein